ncbi:MAG: ATP-binding cassette domain-containing protein [Gammaproteobacteria bacterium]|nr:ATP-binding cassette domain-containing protein [Gammaproteobacteria bacterium]
MSTENQNPFQIKPSHLEIWTLFDYLLAEIGSSAYEKNLVHHYRLSQENFLADFKETAHGLGFVVNERYFNVSQAIAAASHLSPLLYAKDDGSWIVLTGFAGGRIKAARINDNTVDILLLSVPELLELLDCDQSRLTTWFSLELEHPMDAAAEHTEHLPPLKRLYSIMKLEKQDLWRVLLLALASGLLSLATPAAVQSLVNTVALGGLLQPLLILSFMLFVFLIFFGMVTILQSYLMELIQRRLFLRMTADIANRLPRVTWRVANSSNGVERINRFFDVLTLQKSGAFLLLEGLAIVLQAAIGLLVLAAYHPYLMLFDLLIIIWLSVVIFFFGRHGVETAIKESYAKYAVVEWLETLAANNLMVRFAGGTDLARERANKLAFDYLGTRSRHYRILLRQHIGLNLLYAVASTVLLSIGGYLVMEGQLSLGQLVAAEIIVSGVLFSFSKFKKQLENYYDLLAGVDKLGHLLDLPMETRVGDVVDLSNPVSVSVKDVNFAITRDAPVFEGLSFEIAPAEKVAVLSPLGGGKTSLVQLLCALHQPHSGRIEINGASLVELEPAMLRSQIGLAEHIELLNDTIIKNVNLGRPDISVTAIRDVLTAVNLMPAISKLDNGLNTVLSHDGIPLTTIQLEQLMLARATVARPGLLIVDGLLDHWPESITRPVLEYLLAEDAPWTLLLMTESLALAQRCQRQIQLPEPSR